VRDRSIRTDRGIVAYANNQHRPRWNVRLVRWSQPVDATLIENRKDRERVLMSEKCRPGLTAARETGRFGIAGSRVSWKRL